MLGWIILGLFVAFLSVLIIRALLFKPLPRRAINEEPVAFDAESATAALQKLVQCKTVSSYDPAEEDDQPL